MPQLKILALIFALLIPTLSHAEKWRCLHQKVNWISGEGPTKMKAWHQFYLNYHRGFRTALEKRDWRKVDWYKADKNTKGDPRCKRIR
jgi:hypothetical protein